MSKRASQAEALRYLLDKRKAEVAELEKKLEEASRLKVGDYAKIIELTPKVLPMGLLSEILYR
ncbi:hypothetical protein B1222_00125 [Paenibacillus larvae subsp. pulvifaciens]|uniref:hypothetical protein n=1 Tax=Paenibacillus larvae TaxID=1464 RepID=UPI00098ECE34|nr:hypothetical protein [Paenibacillus larvae]AQT83223.1 hypothetical protein B1222_00125 [Paenibacillus larvae subsp. pulvifaciens]